MRTYADSLLERKVNKLEKEIIQLKATQRYGASQVYTQYKSNEISMTSNNYPVTYQYEWQDPKTYPHPMCCFYAKFIGQYEDKQAIIRVRDTSGDIQLGYGQRIWGVAQPIFNKNLPKNEIEMLIHLELVPPGPDGSPVMETAPTLNNIVTSSPLSGVVGAIPNDGTIGIVMSYFGPEEDTQNPIFIWNQTTTDVSYILVQAYDSDNNAIFDNAIGINTGSTGLYTGTFPLAQYGVPSGNVRFVATYYKQNNVAIGSDTMTIYYEPAPAPEVPDTGGGSSGTDPSVPYASSFVGKWYVLANMPGVLKIGERLL